MSNLLPPWDSYLALQTKLKDSTTVDDMSWGREAALDRILASDALVAEEIERAVHSESRKERYRARLRRQHLSSKEDRIDGEAVVKARQHLWIVRDRVTDEDWALLSAVGAGSAYSEIAVAAGTAAASSGALRVRVQRLRQRLSDALAA